MIVICNADDCEDDEKEHILDGEKRKKCLENKFYEFSSPFSASIPDNILRVINLFQTVYTQELSAEQCWKGILSLFMERDPFAQDSC